MKIPPHMNLWDVYETSSEYDKELIEANCPWLFAEHYTPSTTKDTEGDDSDDREVSKRYESYLSGLSSEERQKMLEDKEELSTEAARKRQINELTAQAACLSNEDIEDLLTSIEKTRVQIRMLQDHEAACKEQLKELVGDASRIVDRTGHQLASWSFSDRESFESKKFRDDYPNLYKDYTKRTNIRTLVINGRKMA